MEPNTDSLTLLFVALIVTIPPLLHYLFGGDRHPDTNNEGGA